MKALRQDSARKKDGKSVNFKPERQSWVRRSLQGIQHVSVNEKALKRNHVYATIVRARGVVIDVGEGRTKKGTIASFERIFAEIKGVVETITTDMWTTYITAVETVFPNGALVHDRFHLIQYLNKTINRVRRREAKTNPELKGTRYVLLKNEDNRTQKQDEIFKVIQESNLQVSIAGGYAKNSRGFLNVTPSPKQRRTLNSGLPVFEMQL